jgi:hypothetical protein
MLEHNQLMSGLCFCQDYFFFIADIRIPIGNKTNGNRRVLHLNK